MYHKIFKRLFDIVFSLFGLFLLLILIFPISILIYFDDNGPIFYSSERLGKNGKTFKMYKFRSMRINAPDIRNADGSSFNSEKDLRLTNIGKILRKLSIDELPQFLNVIKGDMSIIGPRPYLPIGISEEILRKINKISKVRPGITGYNQAYYRNSILQSQKIKNDLFYVNNISFVFDIKILLKTFISVFRKEKIYNS